MSDQPENLMLVFLRRIDAKVDRVVEDLADLRHRMTTVEIQISNLSGTESNHYGSLALRLDQYGERLTRIERRLDLAEHG